MFPLTGENITRWVAATHPDKARDPRVLGVYADAVRQVLCVTRRQCMTCHGEKAAWRRDGCVSRCTVCRRAARHHSRRTLCVEGGEPTPVEWEDATRIARPRLRRAGLS